MGMAKFHGSSWQHIPMLMVARKFNEVSHLKKNAFNDLPNLAKSTLGPLAATISHMAIGPTYIMASNWSRACCKLQVAVKGQARPKLGKLAWPYLVIRVRT